MRRDLLNPGEGWPSRSCTPTRDRNQPPAKDLRHCSSKLLAGKGAATEDDFTGLPRQASRRQNSRTSVHSIVRYTCMAAQFKETVAANVLLYLHEVEEYLLGRRPTSDMRGRKCQYDQTMLRWSQSNWPAEKSDLCPICLRSLPYSDFTGGPDRLLCLGSPLPGYIVILLILPEDKHPGLEAPPGYSVGRRVGVV